MRFLTPCQHNKKLSKSQLTEMIKSGRFFGKMFTVTCNLG